MIKTSIGHLVYHVNPANHAWYKATFGFLGWGVIMDAHGFLGFANGDTSLWFAPVIKPDQINDYDGAGLNHIALSAQSIEDVDATVAHLKSREIDNLFQTPQHRPDFAGPGKTYYQVMFKSPDGLLFEVVYTGPYAP